MIIKAFPSGYFLTNAYIVACERTREALIIDPAQDSYSSISLYIKAKNLNPIKIILTHSHWDHIADANLIINSYKIPLFVHEDDAANVKQPGSDRLPCWIKIDPIPIGGVIKENDVVQVGDIIFKVIHTPGHTPGGICLYSEKESILFSGDTLFKGSIGNLSFPTARPNLMWDSLNKLKELPSKTIVYPGHGEFTTIGNESWLSKAKEIFS